MIRRLASLPLTLALALGATTAVAACSDGMQVGSVHVKSGTVGPDGGRLVVTPADHPQLAGTSIVFPAGALAQSTYIAIGLSDANLALDDARPGGPTLYFEPIGLDLAAAAAVTVPYEKDLDPQKLLVRTLAGGEIRDVTARVTGVDSNASLISFELDRLGHTQPQTIFLDPVDAACNSPQCPPPAIDAGCTVIPGTTICQGTDAATPPIDAGMGGGQCPFVCPAGTQCNPAMGVCWALCGNQVCPNGQGCNQDNVCVNQCGMGGAITFLCPPNQVCNFGTGTCHP